MGYLPLSRCWTYLAVRMSFSQLNMCCMIKKLLFRQRKVLAGVAVRPRFPRQLCYEDSKVQSLPGPDQRPAPSLLRRGALPAGGSSVRSQCPWKARRPNERKNEPGSGRAFARPECGMAHSKFERKTGPDFRWNCSTAPRSCPTAPKLRLMLLCLFKAWIWK